MTEATIRKDPVYVFNKGAKVRVEWLGLSAELVQGVGTVLFVCFW
jgi:hypothetical protein